MSSSPLNVVQMEANRRNAQHSTGPRTEPGKKISSLNALRHGLTSRRKVLPSADFSVYLQSSPTNSSQPLPPGPFPETQCAQTNIDIQQWLNCVWIP